jgi:hypothetical protein
VKRTLGKTIIWSSSSIESASKLKQKDAERLGRWGGGAIVRHKNEEAFTILPCCTFVLRSAIDCICYFSCPCR